MPCAWAPSMLCVSRIDPCLGPQRGHAMQGRQGGLRMLRRMMHRWREDWVGELVASWSDAAGKRCPRPCHARDANMRTAHISLALLLPGPTTAALMLRW